MTCGCTGGDTFRGDGGLFVGGSVTLRSGGGMFTLRDAGGTVTLGDSGGIVTRRGGGGIFLTAGCGGNDDWECRLSDGAFKYFGKVNDGLFLGVAELGKWGCRRWVDEGLCQGSRCNDGCIDGGYFGHWALVWK